MVKVNNEAPTYKCKCYKNNEAKINEINQRKKLVAFSYLHLYVCICIYYICTYLFLSKYNYLQNIQFLQKEPDILSMYETFNSSRDRC